MFDRATPVDKTMSLLSRILRPPLLAYLTLLGIEIPNGRPDPCDHEEKPTSQPMSVAACQKVKTNATTPATMPSNAATPTRTPAPGCRLRKGESVRGFIKEAQAGQRHRPPPCLSEAMPVGEQFVPSGASRRTVNPRGSTESDVATRHDCAGRDRALRAHMRRYGGTPMPKGRWETPRADHRVWQTRNGPVTGKGVNAAQLTRRRSRARRLLLSIERVEDAESIPSCAARDLKVLLKQPDAQKYSWRRFAGWTLFFVGRAGEASDDGPIQRYFSRLRRRAHLRS